MRRSLVLPAFLAFLSASPLLAQNTSGSVVGTVKDDSGAVLPGVTASLRGDAIVGTRTDVTNDHGFYRFAPLPPGTYEITFTLSGFGTLKREGVHVPLGGAIEENVGLKLSKLSEELTVTGEAPVVDTQSNQVSTNYDKEWVRNAPIRRQTFFDFINAAPGVNQSSSTDERSTSFGSATTDNSYQLDGTDFTAPLTGAAWPWPNTDAIEEVQVLSLGAPAEYGNLQGAVFNIVTRQGSNSFHGDANFYLQTQGLTSNNTASFVSPDGTFLDACPTEQDPNRRCPYHRDKYRDATFQLSGPIVKDKLWFFAGYQYRRNYESPAGIPPEFPNKDEADRVFLKLNYQLDSKNKLMFAYHDDYYHIPCAGSYGCNSLTAPTTNQLEHGHNPSPNLTFTSVRSEHTYVEARISGFYGKDHADPNVGSEPRVKPVFVARDTGEITGGIYEWYDGNVWKTSGSVKVSHFADNFLGGSHDFKFGVQYNEGGSDYIYGYNDRIYTYGGVPTYGYTQIPFHQGGKEKTLGLWADDTFRVSSRLTLNLGVRYDHGKASFDSFPILDRDGKETGQSSPAVADLFSLNSVSPRVGFNLKLTEDGKTVLKAHYGRYYRGIITGEFDGLTPSIAPLYTFDGTYDDAGTPQGLALVSDISNRRIDPSFKNPYTDQFIASFERELVKNLGLSVSYVHKRGERYGGWKDIRGQYQPATYVDDQGVDATGQPITVSQLTGDLADRLFLLTNPPEMLTRYNGVTFQLTKKMSSHWEMVGSLVLSKSTGRLGSSLLSSTTDRQSGLAGRFGQNPNDYINTDGRLIEDRPVVGKVQLVYELPAGFLVSANFQHAKGRPYSRQVNVSDLVGIPGSNILAEKIDGSRRVADLNVLDMRLQKAFELGKGLSFAVFADALNLTNDNANEGVGALLGTSSGFAVPTQIVYPRRIMLGAKLRF